MIRDCKSLYSSVADCKSATTGSGQVVYAQPNMTHLGHFMHGVNFVDQWGLVNTAQAGGYNGYEILYVIPDKISFGGEKLFLALKKNAGMGMGCAYSL